MTNPVSSVAESKPIKLSNISINLSTPSTVENHFWVVFVVNGQIAHKTSPLPGIGINNLVWSDAFNLTLNTTSDMTFQLHAFSSLDAPDEEASILGKVTITYDALQSLIASSRVVSLAIEPTQHTSQFQGDVSFEVNQHNDQAIPTYMITHNVPDTHGIPEMQEFDIVLQSGQEQCSCNAGLDNPCQYNIRYNRYGMVDDLERCIKHYSSALRMRPASHPFRSSVLINLAVALKNRYKRTGIPNDLDVAIELQTGALDLRPPGHPLRVNVLTNLANTLWVRFLARDDIHDLDVAIKYHTESVDLRLPGDPHRVISLNNLCLALGSRFKRLESREDVDLLIKHYSSLTKLYSTNHPQYYDALSYLANAHIHRYERQGDLQDLESAITYHSIVLKYCGIGHPRRPYALNDLSKGLLARFRQRGQLDDMEAAIDHCNSALELCPPGHPCRFSALANLANAITLRYQRKGNLEDLKLAVEYNIQASTLCPLGHPHRPEALTSLATAYISRFTINGNPHDLDLAVERYDEALQLCGSAHSQLPLALFNVANAYRVRYELCGDLADLDLALTKINQALEIPPLDHPKHYGSVTNVGACLLVRYEQRGVGHDLDTAIEHFSNALDICPPGHLSRPDALVNLGSALGSRYDRDGANRDLELAMDFLGQALELRPPGDPHRANATRTLANLFWFRFQKQGDFRDLELALENCRDTIELCPPRHIHQLPHFSILACALVARFDHQGDIGDLTQALEYFQKCKELCPPVHRHRVAALDSLGVVLLYWYKQSENLRDLNLAIQNHTEALRLVQKGHPRLPAILCHLGNDFRQRFAANGDRKDLDMSISLYDQALHILPADYPAHTFQLVNLALAILARYEESKELEDLELVFNYLHDALKTLPDGHPQLHIVFHIFSSAYLSKFHSSASSDDREKVFEYLESACMLPSAGTWPQFQNALVWIETAEEEDHPSKLKAYKASLDFLDRFVLVTSSVARRYSMLKGVPSSLVPNAASCAIGNDNTKLAVEMLEQGRGLLWAQLARLRTPLEDLRNTDQEGQRLADEFQQITTLLNREDFIPGLDDSKESLTIEEDAERYRKLWKEWDANIEKIRAIDGFASFLRPASYDELARAAIHGPVIVLNMSEYSCDAILVFYQSEPCYVHLPEASLEQVMQLSEKFTYALKNTTGVGEERNREKELTLLLRTLWVTIVEPVARALESFRDIVPTGSRIWWCPTSKSAALPLHAAGPYRRGEKNLSQLYISSYTPTLSALIRSRRMSPTNSTKRTRAFLAVGQAKPYGGSDESELEFVNAELDLVRSLASSSFTYSQVTDNAATSDGVLDELRTSDWVHLACHGKQDFSDPYNSSFALRDKPLRLMDIIHANLANPEFAFLSACHTALGDDSTPDEVIHLAAAMQFSGFRSVIGTLWAVDDKTATFMVAEFYKNLFKEGADCTGAAKALNKAVKTVDKMKIPLDQRIVFIHIGA